MKKIFITGGSGLIGTNAVEHFVNNGYEVLNYDLRSPQNTNYIKYWIQGDIMKKDQYLETVTNFQPDFFLHLAARTDLLEKNNLGGGYKANIGGVQNTIDVTEATPSIQRVLYASTRLVCTIDYTPKHDEDYCPPNLYGESKVIGERLVRDAKLSKEWMIFRPTSHWGPWFDAPYIIFFKMIQQNRYFHPGSHSPRKSFGYVKNSVYQLEKLMTASKEQIQGKTLYLCDYPPLELQIWAELISKAMKKKKIARYPMWLLKTAATIGDVLAALGWNRVPLTNFRLTNLITDMVYDTSDLEKICGELPHSLEVAVKDTVEWMKTNTNRDKLALAEQEYKS
jgi:nucleoside-diphosphate-sugar epimerase